MKKVLSVILALCMLAMLLPAAALADGEVLAQNVYVAGVDEHNDPNSFTFDLGQAIWDDPIGLYLSGAGTYELTEDLSDMVLIVNGVSVALGESGKIGGGLLICGGGSILSNSLLIESEAPAVPAELGDPDEIFGFIADNVEGKPLLLSGEINEIFTADDVIIAAGKPLVIKSAPEGADPNVLNIEKSLNVREGASLTGELGQILQIGRGASVEGLTLYDSDGETVWTDNSHDETFNYDADSGRWIRCDPGPGGPGPGEFRLIYDDNLGLAYYDDNFDGTPNHECHGDFVGTFVAGEGDEAEIKAVKLKFEPDANTFGEDETVSVSILLRVFGEPDVENWVVVCGEAADGYSFADGVFSFAPASDAPFELSMVWTQNAYEFETCEADPEQGQKLVEYGAAARGHVEFSASEGNIVKSVVDRQRGKIVLAPYAEEVVFTILPDEDNELTDILVGRDPGSQVDLANDSRYNAEAGTFTLEIDEEEAEYFIEFVFSDVGPGGPDEPMQDNKYHVVFTDTLGTVKAGETALENDGLYDFEAETSIAFTLTPNDAAAEPFVELEVFDGSTPEDETFIPNTVYDSLLKENDPEHNRYALALTEGENGVRSFTFTPASSKHFELRVYWSDKDRFDSFFCGEDEMFVEYRIIGNGDVSFGDAELGGWCGYHDKEDGFDHYKQAVKKTVTSLGVTIAPHEGWKLGSLGLAGTPLDESAYAVENGVASYTWTELDKGLDVVFVEDGEPGPGPGYDYAKAKQQVESRDYAYCGTADEIKGYFAQELWAEIFGELLRWNGEAFEPVHAGEFSGMFGAAEAPEYAGDDLVCAVTGSFLDAITLGEKQTASENDALALPYREYSVALPDGETVAQGRIYELEKTTQFVVRAGEAYTVVDTAAYGEGEDIVIRAAGGEDFAADVFGNGVCVAGGLDAGEGVLWAGHVTQEHSGLDIGSINARVIIVPNDFLGVRIDGEAWAAPWGFGTVPLYPVGTQDEPADAVVYYGNDGTEGRVLKLYKDSGVAGNKTVAHVEIDETRLSPAAATITQNNDYDFEFKFHTSFGLIPLIVTFVDGSKGYLDLYRTGLDVQYHEVGEGRIFVRHGLEGTEYGSDAERAVTGSFYYATGEAQPSESVTLFVTVTTVDGVERREVSRLNGSFIGTEGSDKWCDDFLLWSGTEAEWAEIVSVEAEVVSSGTAAGGTVETLGGEASASSVAFEGTVSAYVSAVRVQLLDGEELLATDGFPVVNGAFSGSFEGLALEAGKTYTLRAADYDGGEWKTVEVEVPGGSTPPSPPTPPTPPSPGGGGSTAAEKFTLTFDSNGGTEIEPVEAAEGTVVDLSEYVPEKDGYEFVGWCGSPSLGDVLEEVALTQDITVYAKWRIACDHGEGCPLSAFTDLDPDAWYHEGVHFCLTRGIMNGIGGGLFDPAGTATRAQIVTMLYRLEGEPAVDGDNPFTDVPADSFCYKSTAWASAEGIVNGYGDGIFAPDDLVTREQAATILYRYAKYKGVDVDALSANTNTLSYTDVFTISDFARPAMHFCIAIHVLNGYDGYLRPQDTAARAEVAAMFQRLCDAIF